MIKLLKSRVFLVTLGLILLGVLIWFAGPYFAFAGHAPLATVIARLLVMLVLAVGYAAYVQLRQLKSAQASRQLGEQVANQASAAPASPAGGDAAQLRKRFEEAIEALKRSRKKGAASLYELPWYVIIGPPGAGKTTLLVNSGLHFPLAQKFGKEAVRGVGGTRNCDWWFTNEAILLDTAGRFTTQDSSASADAAGWSAFLQLLRKFRGRQPINGVIVAVSATDLIVLSESEREQQIHAVRARLEELGRELAITVPVYVLVTKCDLIAGFSEFFEDLDAAGRAQVWGTTFPIEVSESGQAATHYGTEFDELIARLQQRVLVRMSAERDPRRRTSVLAFPQQLSALGPALNELLQRVFSASGFERLVLLRGVYFTSGTQEGAPIDRMLGAIARTFGVSGAVAPPAPGRGRAYFIDTLLRGVIFPESGLAGVNRVVQARMILARSGAYIGCLAVLVLLLAWLMGSYDANAAYLERVSTATHAYQQLGKPADLSVAAGLPRLDALRHVAQQAEQYRGKVPWYMRAGLYQGAEIGTEARDAYVRELNATLVPALAEQWQQTLQGSVASPQKLYAFLKGYLMLGSAQHRDPDYLRYVAKVLWHSMYPQDSATARELDEQFNQLLTHDRLSSIPLDTQAVAQARIALRSASLPVLIYDQLKLRYLNDTTHSIRLDLKIGTGSSVLVRRSGTPLSQPIPALYTRAVFERINSKSRYELVADFLKNSWVFGAQVPDLHDSGGLAYQVMSLYESDYLQYWKTLVQDVGIRSAGSPQQFIDTLGIISSPASPLKGFLRVVARNTDLLKPPKSAAAALGGALASAKLNALKKVIGSGPQGAPPPGTRVTSYFAPIRQLVSGPPGQAPIDQMLATLNQQYQRLLSTGSGVGQQSALDPSVQAAMRGARQSLALLAQELPAPIGRLAAQVAVRSASIVNSEASGELAKLYQAKVVRPCRELVSGRYPLDPNSPSDAALGDFAHVFGPNGVFATFFRSHLAQLVDTTSVPWRWRAGAAAGSAAMLQQFERARRIREVFFPSGSAQPRVRFNLMADVLDPTVSSFRLNVDGQRFKYAHGPVQSSEMSWPGSLGEATFEFTAPAGNIPGPVLQGPWAWFRLLGEARVVALSGTRYRVAFRAGGKSMSVLLNADSIRNPFAQDAAIGFHCNP